MDFSFIILGFIIVRLIIFKTFFASLKTIERVIFILLILCNYIMNVIYGSYVILGKKYIFMVVLMFMIQMICCILLLKIPKLYSVNVILVITILIEFFYISINMSCSNYNKKQIKVEL